jgi:hypothetical protein
VSVPLRPAGAEEYDISNISLSSAHLRAKRPMCEATCHRRLGSTSTGCHPSVAEQTDRHHHHAQTARYDCTNHHRLITPQCHLCTTAMAAFSPRRLDSSGMKLAPTFDILLGRGPNPARLDEPPPRGCLGLLGSCAPYHTRGISCWIVHPS